MFGNVIYFDNKKVNEYKTIINGQKLLQVEEYEISNDKGAQIDLKIIGADAKASKSYTAKVTESKLYDCNEFEKLLYGRDDYFDLSLNSDYDISTMLRGTIIKFDGFISIPEEFDLTQTIGKFKPYLVNSIIDSTMDKTEQDALKFFLDTPDAKIPINIECEGELFCSKMISENMLISYEGLEEFEDLEVSVIARITTNRLISKTKAFYDPLKDFMSLNRTLRRSIGERTDGMNELFVDQDYRTIEILAIYQ